MLRLDWCPLNEHKWPGKLYAAPMVSGSKLAMKDRTLCQLSYPNSPGRCFLARQTKGIYIQRPMLSLGSIWCDWGRVLTRKYYLKILSENWRAILFYKRTTSSSNDSQYYLKILSKSAGQHRRQHEHGAKTGLRQSCGRAWPSVCFYFPWDEQYFVNIHSFSSKLNGLEFLFLEMWKRKYRDFSWEFLKLDPWNSLAL